MREAQDYRIIQEMPGFRPLSGRGLRLGLNLLVFALFFLTPAAMLLFAR